MPLEALSALLSLLARARTRGPGVLAVAACLVVVAGVFAFGHEARAAGLTVSWHEALYCTLGLFTFAGNRFGYPKTGALTAVYFAAPVISTSAILGALLHLLEERAPLFARRFRGHTVIGGLGRLGVTLARDLEKHRRAFIGIELRDDAADVANLRVNGAAVVIVGDMTSAEVLRRAGCDRAAEVFFTTPSDVANLDAAFNVRRLAREARHGDPPRIYAHVYDVALGDALQHQLRASGARDAQIIPFNSYRFAAKALVATLLRDRVLRSLRVAPGLRLARTAWPAGDDTLVHRKESIVEDRRRLMLALRLEVDTLDESVDRYAVVGLGRFGRSVLRELLDVTPRATRFLVVERALATYESSCESFTADERARFDLCVADATSARAVAAIEAFAPTAVLVCTDNDISNLRLALVLHRREVKIVTRMFDLEASAELGRGLDERGICPVGIARLFRTAIPILTHERQLLACVNLDVARTPHIDHLFYLARVTDGDRARLGDACVTLDELPRDEGVEAPPKTLALVWHRRVNDLAREPDAVARETARGDLDP